MKPRSRHSRLIPLLALVVLLVTVFAVAACGSATSATTTVSQAVGSTSATTQADATKTYTSKTDGYSFLYPKSWEVADQTSVGVTAGGSSVSEIGVADPAGASADGEKIDVAIVSVYKLTATIDASMMSDVRTEVEQVLSNIESQTPGIKTLDALSQVSFNNMLGFKVTYSFAKSGVPVTSTMYFLFSGNVEYQISVQAADPNWAQDKPIFDAMIASFQPGPSK